MRATQTQLAKHWGISQPAASKLVKKWGIPVGEDGLIDVAVADAIRAAKLNVRQQRRAQQQRAALAKQGDGATMATSDPLSSSDWRIRRERADAEHAEIDLAKVKEQLVSRATVEAQARRAGYAIVGSMMPLPDRVAAECGMSEDHRVLLRQVLQREMDRICTDVANALKTGTQ